MDESFLMVRVRGFNTSQCQWNPNQRFSSEVHSCLSLLASDYFLLKKLGLVDGCVGNSLLKLLFELVHHGFIYLEVMKNLELLAGKEMGNR